MTPVPPAVLWDTAASAWLALALTAWTQHSTVTAAPSPGLACLPYQAQAGSVPLWGHSVGPPPLLRARHSSQKARASDPHSYRNLVTPGGIGGSPGLQ